MPRPRTKNKHLPPRMRIQSGSYYYDAGKDASGKRKWIRLSRSLSEALLKWAEIEGRNLAGSTVAHALDRYLIECLDELAPVTQREYRRISARLRMTFGHMRLVDVQPPHIARYLDEHPYTVSANKEIGMLSSVFRFAVRWGWCPDNPCRKVERTKDPKRHRYVEDDEFLAVRSLAWEYQNENGEHPWRPLAVAMDISYLATFRLSDVIAIKVSDIEGDELRIREGKTGWKARALITEGLQAVIDRAMHLRRRVCSVYLIVTREGLPYTASGFKSAWQRLQRHALAAGVISERYTFNDIRAKHATDRDELGFDAMLNLGHMDYATTKRYIRSRRGRKIVPLDRLEGGKKT